MTWTDLASRPAPRHVLTTGSLASARSVAVMALGGVLPARHRPGEPRELR